MEYTFYIRLEEGQKLPDSVPDAEIIDKGQVLGSWWKLTLAFPDEKFNSIVKWLMRQGYRLARSANYSASL